MTEADKDELELTPLILNDGELWVADPDLLHPDSGCEDVLAVQYTGGQLWILDGKAREWVDVAKSKAKPTTLKTIK